MFRYLFIITVLFREKQIQDFLADKVKVKKIVAFKRKEELNRRGGVDADRKVSDFSYFSQLKESKEFKTKFSDMQKVYVLNQNDLLRAEEIFDAISELQKYIDIGC